jgi:predicted NAD/FAD-binding protein
MKIAIIGSGISGNVAAHILAKSHDVTVYEKRDRAGGHSATKDIDYTGNGDWMSVDTGFIVYNDHNYPGLVKLFKELKIETEESNMSFGFSANRGAFEWSGQSIASVFAQKSNWINPIFWLMLRDIFKFNKQAARDHESGHLGDMSLGKWLKRNRLSGVFINRYLLPMGAAIWSTPADEILNFPAASFLQFFYNHRLINKNRPQWRTVTGGSREYVKKITAGFKNCLHLSAEVTHIERHANGVDVTANGTTETYDHIVMAAHSNESLAMLGDASRDETDILSAVRYLPNDVYLHRDESLMPKRQTVWSAWNYISRGKSGRDAVMSVSYWMNRLQNLDYSKPLFVTLNPPVRPTPEKTFGHYVYDHPQFDAAAMRAQNDLPTIQGVNRTWFCGAWCGFGFHEDGLQSALKICKQIAMLKDSETEEYQTIEKAAAE